MTTRSFSLRLLGLPVLAAALFLALGCSRPPVMVTRYILDYPSPGFRGLTTLQHVFCHRAAAYEFLDQGPTDWMTRHFFEGGIMPSDGLALRFQDRLALRARWRWDGRHYARTAEAWLANLDARRQRVLPILARTYGAADAERWLMRWRLFFLAVAELFAWDEGQEWWVAHYLFRKR